MSSEEFCKEAVQNKTGKNIGIRSIWLNCGRKNKVSGKKIEHPNKRFDAYRATDFSRFRAVAALVSGDSEPTETMGG